RAAGGDCGTGLACDAAAAGAWARAWWLVSAFSRETTAMTAMAATTARQAQPNQIRHRANRFARLPGLRMSVHIPHTAPLSLCQSARRPREWAPGQLVHGKTCPPLPDKVLEHVAEIPVRLAYSRAGAGALRAR